MSVDAIFKYFKFLLNHLYEAALQKKRDLRKLRRESRTKYLKSLQIHILKPLECTKFALKPRFLQMIASVDTWRDKWKDGGGRKGSGC